MALQSKQGNAEGCHKHESDELQKHVYSPQKEKKLLRSQLQRKEDILREHTKKMNELSLTEQEKKDLEKTVRDLCRRLQQVKGDTEKCMKAHKRDESLNVTCVEPRDENLFKGIHEEQEIQDLQETHAAEVQTRSLWRCSLKGFFKVFVAVVIVFILQIMESNQCLHDEGIEGWKNDFCQQFGPCCKLHYIKPPPI